MSLLAGWHANPLDDAAAHALLQQARAGQRRGNRQRRCRYCLLQEMIARFWLGEDLNELRRHLSPRLQRSAHSRALLELVTGQLLITRRLQGARHHMQQGFLLAARLLTPGDYFAVLKRHQQLAHLPLRPTPLPPATLSELLVTAQVIERMQRAAPLNGPHDPTDLYG